MKKIGEYIDSENEITEIYAITKKEKNGMCNFAKIKIRTPHL